MITVCLMVPSVSAQEASAIIVSPNTVRFVVRRTAHRRLAKILGSRARFQSITFNPLALTDQAMAIDVRLPHAVSMTGDSMDIKLSNIHGFLVARLKKQCQDDMQQMHAG